ncbi:MAG: PGF-pre-PGF domain-containing protein, partial [Nanoarchaeota archaeon]
LNVTGLKEINLFVGGGNYAPKRISPTFTQLIIDNNRSGNFSNITIGGFDPQAIGTALASSAISMNLYFSNSSCDVPNPISSCLIGGSSSTMTSFNPMSSIIGGGKLSFRMGTGGILVHYVNVDMMASGPPDALFDSSTTNSGAGSSFNNAIRFGSAGPTVYDYVLVSIPYSDTVGSGLDEDQPVTMSIPALYDENWNVIWNSTINGTSSAALAGNFSHYANRQGEWTYLLNETTCGVDVNALNVSKPCYLDTGNNRIWIRLPHFSGTGPSAGGTVRVSASSGSSGGVKTTGAATITTPPIVETISANEISKSIGIIFENKEEIVKIEDKDFGLKQIGIKVNKEATNVEVNVNRYSDKPSGVDVAKEGKVYRYLQINVKNLEDKLEKAKIVAKVEKSWISNNNLNKDDIAMFKFSNGKWRELRTEYKEQDGDFYYYDIELDSFSYFAIGQKIYSEKEPPIEMIEERQGVSQSPPEINKIKILKWILGLIFVGIVVFIFWYFKKKK